MKIAMEKPERSLSVRDLSCIRDNRLLFEHLNFSLNNGQVLLLEGKNGCGKTSLLRILCGFREPDAGDVFWHDQPVNDSEFYQEMGYVGHLDGIKKELTVEENLRMSLALNLSGSYSINQALKKVELEGYNFSYVQSLSAGQKRRVSLARLLITFNILWVLDEPFTSLDRPGIKLIESLMQEHVASGGMIILTSHHELNVTEVPVQRISLSPCH